MPPHLSSFVKRIRWGIRKIFTETNNEQRLTEAPFRPMLK